MWLQSLYSRDQYAWQGAYYTYNQVKQRMGFDCTLRYRMVAYHAYSGTCEVYSVPGTDGPSAWIDIVPESLGEVWRREVCAFVRRR